jgi:hypothetical protein
MRTMKVLAVMLAGAALVGCGGKMTTTDAGTGGGLGTGGGFTTGGGGGGGGGSTGGGSGRTDAGVDAGVMMGTSCANAIPVAYGDTKMGTIDTAGKKIFYKFSADAGEFIEIATDSNPDDLSDVLDTAVTVYNATGATVLASIDDAYPRISTDTDLYFQIPSAGDYCFSVEDWSSWAGEPPVARPADPFTVGLDRVSPTAALNTFDAEPNDMTTAPQTGKVAMGTMFAFGRVYGKLDSATDVDVYKFTIPATTSQISIDFAPLGVPAGAGDNGYGSGLERISVSVLATDGTVLGRWLTSTGTITTTPDSIGVPASGDVLVKIERPAGSTATGNDFYVAAVSMTTDNPAETADTTNDVAATPEVIALTVDPMDAKRKSGFILGTIGTATDVDHYSIAVSANDTVSMACGALRTGSGLTATYAVLDSAGTTTLQTETESPTRDIYWGTGTSASKGPVTATAAGNVLMKVSGTLDATNTGKWYRCGIFVVTP